MTTSTDISNMALSAVGTRSSIVNLNEGSIESNECSKWYNTTRRQLIRMALWGFARKYVNLALYKSAPGTPENPNALVNTSGIWSPAYPPPPWMYEYAYPSDCLFARFVFPAPMPQVAGVPIFSTTLVSPNQISGPPVKSVIAIDSTDTKGNPLSSPLKVILTNQENATLCYNTDVTVEDLWDESFKLAMVAALGAAISLQLTGDKGTRDRLFQEANQMVMTARERSANESFSQQNIVPDWIRQRGVSYGWDGSTYMLDQFGPLFPVAI
jgi:hypothetical protein